jgi:hypothetical protein
MDQISSRELLKLVESVLDASKKAENDDTAERVSSRCFRRLFENNHFVVRFFNSILTFSTLPYNYRIEQ